MTIPGIVIIIPGRGDGPCGLEPFGSRVGAERVAGVHPKEALLGRATLDKNRAIGVPLKRGGIHIADRTIVHAKIRRSAAAPVRVGPEPRSDRSQLFDLSSERFELPETRSGGGGQLAAAGRLG